MREKNIFFSDYPCDVALESYYYFVLTESSSDWATLVP